MSGESSEAVHDPDRLRSLHETGLLDSAPEEVFDHWVRLAARLTGTPAAAVSLVDRDRQFLKSCVGIPEPWASRREMPIAYSYCQHAVASREPLLIEDAREHPLVKDSPAVTENRAIAYAGIPLITSTGHALGTLCVIDTRPRSWTEEEIESLRDLARAVVTEIELRRSVREIENAERLAEELRHSEERFRLLAETAPDAILTIDRSSAIVYANPAAEQIFGYSAGDLMGMSMVELMPEHLRDPHRAGLRRYLETGRRHIPWRGLELPGRHRSGRQVLLEVSFTEFVRDGKHFFTGTMRDITERKRIERDLAAQFVVARVLAEAESVEETMPRLLEEICRSLAWEVGAYWCVDSNGQVLRLVEIWTTPSRRGGEFEQASREIAFAPGVGLPGRVWSTGEPAWIPDITRGENFPRLPMAAGDGLHGAFAFPVAVADDFIGVIEFFTSAVVEVDESLLRGMDALGRDIGQFIKRKRAEADLRNREQIQSFFAQVSAALTAAALDYRETLRRLARLAVPVLGEICAIYMLRDGGEVERVEVAAADPEQERAVSEVERLSGGHMGVQAIQTGRSVLLTEMPDSLLQEVARDESHLRMMRDLKMKSAMIVPLIARERILGSIAIVSAGANRVYDRQDLEVAEEFARRAALTVDNARLYHESQEANRAKAEFLAVMSHELRTPLNAVIGYAELMRMGIAGNSPEQGVRYAERIGYSAQYLLKLIEEVLTFARLEAGKERVSISPVDVGQLVEEIRSIAEPMASAKQLGFEVTPPETPVDLESDPGKVRQILLNLISNAIKFTEAGEIEFAVEQGDGEIVFRVCDTGLGIAPEHQEKIFDSFWQIEQSKTRVAEGVGLGLSVARRLVELLGGRIELTSAPGEGSTFTAHLPLRPPGAVAEASVT